MFFILIVGLILVVPLEGYMGEVYYNDTNFYNFTWVPDVPILDCVCSVTYNYAPGTVGVFIARNMLVTSEKAAIKGSYSYGTHTYSHILVPNATFDRQRGFSINKTIGDRHKASKYQVVWHGKEENDPLHDLVFMMINGLVNRTMGFGRHPYYIDMASMGTIAEPSGWLTGAFALVDKYHVAKSTHLIPLFYAEPVLVDCDEWFPRYWGLFICIMNLDNYPVIESGAPLIQNRLLFGIASFTMKRGRESIFVFTDLREYQAALRGIFEEHKKEVKF